MTESDSLLREQAEVANMLFQQGKFGEALEKYRIMADAGSIEAHLRVGWMYQTGRGAKVDLDEARRWYLKAAENNWPEAQFYLGRLFRSEKGYQHAMNCFQKSAEQNYMPSVYQLGVMYERGEGVGVNKDKAYQYYEQASRMGHLRAQRDLAVMMISGQAGFKRMFQGIFLLARVLYNTIKLGLKDPESDRLRW